MIEICKPVSKDRDLMYRMLQNHSSLSPEEADVELNRIDQTIFDAQQNHSIVLIARTESERLIGYICFGAEPISKGSYIIYSLTIAPEAESMEIDKLLLEKAEVEIKRRGGEFVFTHIPSDKKNCKKIDFFINHGFVYKNQVLDYYGPGTKQLIFVKELN